MKKVSMRTNCDCMVASLAMLLNCTYEQSASFFPPKAISETGYRFEWLSPFLKRNGIDLVWYDNLNLMPDWSKPALLDVPSLTSPERGDHVIFWDGKKVIDPSVLLNKYTEIPDEVNAIYQLKYT